MSVALLTIGIIFIGYYIALLLYTRNLKSSFTWVWAAVGAALILLSRYFAYMKARGESVPARVLVPLEIIFLGFAISFVIVEAVVMKASYQDRSFRALAYLIVLGAQVRGERITKCLRKRLDTAHDYWEECPTAKIIVTGGAGRGEDVTEAEAMKRYLYKCGIPEDQIIIEPLSTSSYENLRESLYLISAPDEAVGIVTNNYHMYRALQIARKVGFRDVTGVTASTPWVLWLNYMVREYFAIIKNRITRTM